MPPWGWPSAPRWECASTVRLPSERPCMPPAASAETTLAAMTSSPTLNVIVLTMLFAMFPAYMAVIKIGLTVGFILIGIPLLTRRCSPPPRSPGGSGNRRRSPLRPLDWTGRTPSRPLAGQRGTWPQAGRWVVSNFARNLWFVIKTTVPLDASCRTARLGPGHPRAPGHRSPICSPRRGVGPGSLGRGGAPRASFSRCPCPSMSS